jgi:hypothetical protein
MNPISVLLIVLGCVALLFVLGCLTYFVKLSRRALLKEYVGLVKRRNTLILKIEEECNLAGREDIFINNIKSYIHEARKEENK